MPIFPQAGWSPAGQTQGSTQPRQAIYTGQAFGPAVPPTYTPPQPVLNYNFPLPSAPTSSYSSGGGGVPSTSQAIPSNNQQPYQNIQQQQENGNSQIEADYNNAMSQLSGQEGSLKDQAGAASGAIDIQAGEARNQLVNSQATQEQSTQASLQSAEKQGQSALQQARDLFRQTQQSNSAQLSAMGISSSSVSEALAERLGVETARRIAGVTGSLDEVRQNTSKELGRIQTYYTGQLDTLAKNVENQKAQIQNALVQGLNSINSARNQAASDKASARSNLLSQVQNQIYSLTTQQQQFQQSLEQWAAQKAAALTPIVQDPNYVQKLLAQTQNIQQNFTPSGFVATPSFNVDKTGQYTGQIQMQKKPVDELTNPFATTQ